MSRRWAVSAVLAMLVCFSSGWLLQRRLGAGTDVYQQARLFETVLARVRDYHVDSLPEAELYRRATDGMLKELQDPYAALLVGKDYARLQERTTGDYVGIGLQVDARNGWITVVAPMPGTPAERLGIRPGDQLTEVDGLSAAGWTLDRAVQALRGQVGSPIDVAMMRDGSAGPVRFHLNRERIHQRAVPEGVLLNGGVGYLSLTMNRENSAAELAQEITRLVGEGMKSLVLDLRSNPGGLRDEAVQAADLFLDPQQRILVSRGRAPGDNHVWLDGAPQRWRGMPIVVLVNRGTASAAEIIAGALQDHDRALVVGDTTYGKGIVQTVFPLGPEVALRMTTARWYTPSGRSIQGALLDSVMGAEHSVAVQVGFQSDAGRVLPGGGGIVPDVRLEPDTLSSAEQLFARALEGQMSSYRDVLTAYALRLRSSQEIRSESFEITPIMRQEVRRLLQQRGVAVSDSVFGGGAQLIDEQLAHEIVRYRFGPAAERRRRVADDPQIGRAVALLRNAPTPQALLGMAAAAPGH
jgi:carboxyl-terminal processing protease